MLSVLDSYTLDNPDEIAKEIANDFRKRRIEKNLTREQVSEKAGVAVSNIVRFEHNGIRLHFGDKEAFFRTKILHHGGATTNPQEYQQEKST